MKKGKSIATVALNVSTVKKINTVKKQISNGFVKFSQQDVVEAVFKLPAETIIRVVNESQLENEKVSPVRTKRARRKKIVRLDKRRSEELRTALRQSGKVVVESTKEAASLYNYFKTQNQKVKYSSKKKGGIVVEFA